MGPLNFPRALFAQSQQVRGTDRRRVVGSFGGIPLHGRRAALTFWRGVHRAGRSAPDQGRPLEPLGGRGPPQESQALRPHRHPAPGTALLNNMMELWYTLDWAVPGRPRAPSTSRRSRYRFSTKWTRNALSCL
eukprot:3659998-Rhodomonas_salina.1